MNLKQNVKFSPAIGSKIRHAVELSTNVLEIKLEAVGQQMKGK